MLYLKSRIWNWCSVSVCVVSPLSPLLLYSQLSNSVQFVVLKMLEKVQCKCNEKTKKKHSHTVNKDCIPKQKTPQTALLKSPPKGSEARGSVLDDELQLTLQQEEAGLLHAQKAKVPAYNP